MYDVDRLLVRVGRDRRHGYRVVAAENVWHHPRIKQRTNRKLGVCEAAPGVGIDNVAVAA
jgi:hypothetical protein